MERAKLVRALLATVSVMKNLQGKDGDAQLQPDPYSFHAPDGVIISLHSNRLQNMHLTYGMILKAARGMLEVLIGQKNYLPGALHHPAGQHRSCRRGGEYQTCQTVAPLIS